MYEFPSEYLCSDSIVTDSSTGSQYKFNLSFHLKFPFFMSFFKKTPTDKCCPADGLCEKRNQRFIISRTFVILPFKSNHFNKPEAKRHKNATNRQQKTGVVLTCLHRFHFPASIQRICCQNIASMLFRHRRYFGYILSPRHQKACTHSVL